MAACTQTGCGGAIEDGYCNACGLAPATTYGYRVVARNGVGTTRGTAATFVTPASARTGRARARDRHTAVATALLAARGQGVSWWFEFGTTTAYGSETAAGGPVAGNGTKTVATAVSGLTPATTYHFRVVATNASGTTNGADQCTTSVCESGAVAEVMSRAAGPTRVVISGSRNSS